MNKKGFTLVELLVTILLVILLGSLISTKVISIINDNRLKGYREIEKRLEEAAAKYLTENYVDNNETSIQIDKDKLIEGKYIDEIYDLKDKSVCDAHVIVNNLNGIADYKTILECANYETIIEIVLNVDPNGGQISQSFKSSYKTGEVITLEDPTRNGYAFVGWEVVSGDGIISENSITMGYQDTTIKANWSIDVCTITYELNGGTAGSSAPTSGNRGSTVTVSNPTRTGYSFNGWTVTKGATEGAMISGTNLTIGSSDITLTANWKINTYTISYTLNGGTAGSSAPTSGTYGSTVTVSNPTKLGYAFTGWTVAGTGAILSGTNLTIGTSDVTLTANWKLLNLIVSYKCANTSLGSSYNFTYTGNCEVIDDGNNNWRVRFLTSGSFTLTENIEIDAFLVGGGGGGGVSSSDYIGGGGGGSGEVYTKNNLSLQSGTYSIVVGNGGISNTAGQSTSAFSYTVLGGNPGSGINGGSGGSGGGGGGYSNDYSAANGGQYGRSGNEASRGGSGGAGKILTTCEFGKGATSGCDANVTLYASGGSGGAGKNRDGYSGTVISGISAGAGSGGSNSVGGDALPNTGSGGGGGGYSGFAGGAGGSGIVIIRNTRSNININNSIVGKYTGIYQIVDDNNNIINDTKSWSGNWKIKFITSGDLILEKDILIDAFLVGGGGGGGVSSSDYIGGGGGGSGEVYTKNNLSLQSGTYSIVVGNGGISNTAGQSTSAFSYTVSGGNPGNGINGGSGGSGGGGGGYSNDYSAATGGQYGNSGNEASRGGSGGAGKSITTCEFGKGTTSGCDANVTLYASGGSGGAGKNRDGYSGTVISGISAGAGSGGSNSVGGDALPNTGSGGGGGGYSGFAGGFGGDGIVIIRNAR